MHPFSCLQNLVLWFIFNNLQQTGAGLRTVLSIINKRNRQMDPDEPQIGRAKSSDTWECTACSFRNIALLPNCEICETPKPHSDPIDAPASSVPSGFECHICQYVNSKLVSSCENCGEVLIPDDSEDEGDLSTKKKPAEEKKKLTTCPSCGFENDPDNVDCVSCENSLSRPRSFIPTGRRRAVKAPRRPRASIKRQACPYCGLFISTTGVFYGGFSAGVSGHEICPKMPAQELELRFKTMNRKYCTFCYQKCDPQKSIDHDKQCKNRQDFFSTDSQTYQRTTKLQQQTMIYMHKKSEKFHWMAEDILLKRIEKLGYTAEDLENLHHYIVNYAPIIIHMHANNHMQFFVKDTHYRNQFQTKKSSGSLSSSSRTNWEDRMFDNLHHNATPFERVKYGTINFTNDPKGVRACSSYGQSYFLLKPHVRNRCTVTDMDSSSPSSTIGTFQFCYNVLSKLPDAELQAAFSGSKANEVASTMIGSYKQIQIHGPVEFKKDIERVYINKAELDKPGIMEMVKKFCKDNELEYEIFQYEGVSAYGVPIGHIGGFFGAPAPILPIVPAVPSAPYVPSTMHLFGRGPPVARYPIFDPIPDKDEEEGVDYI